MRLKARVLEGGDVSEGVVPLRTLLAFKEHHGKGINHYISAVQDPTSGVEFDDYEPWLAWRTMVDVNGEERDFDEWAQAVEWIGIYSAPDELDPSGGEATQNPPSSPGSSSAPTARGRSSSRSTTSSKPRSGKS